MSHLVESILSALVLVLWLAPTLLAVAFALNFAITRAFRLSLEPALAPPGVAGARRS
jgi:hypothetical protein